MSKKCEIIKVAPGEVSFINSPIPREIKILNNVTVEPVEGGCGECVVRNYFNCDLMARAGWCPPGTIWKEKIQKRNKLSKKIGFKING